MGRGANVHIRNEDGHTPFEVVLLFVFDKLTFSRVATGQGEGETKPARNFIFFPTNLKLYSEIDAFAPLNGIKCPTEVGVMGYSISKLYHISNVNNDFIIFQVAEPDSRGKHLLKSKLDLELCQASIRPRVLHRYKEMNEFTGK